MIGSFILNWCLENGFKYVKDKKESSSKTFTTLISDTGLFYQITIWFYKNGNYVKKATFYDSLKIIPMSVKAISKAFNLEETKLKIDYNKERPKEGYELTDEEKDYIKNDVVIVAKALKTLFSENLNKMTQGSNALGNFKDMLDKNKFSYYFPLLDKEVDKDIRRAYKGGFTYLNPIYKEEEVGSGVVLDINSLYPYVMHEKVLPYGEPIYFEGKYQEDKVYPLYVQMITCSFKLKKGKIPTIQIKGSFFFRGNEYLESSESYEGNIVELVMTSVDLKLFLEQYDVEDLRYIAGYKFKGKQGIFTEYIDKWTKVKIESTLSGNKGKRTMAKLMLNALYGKFATSLVTRAKIPYMQDDIVKYLIGDEEDKKGLYIPVGAFITSYAREKTIRTSQAIKDYSIKTYGKDLYIYSDTDSIHTTLPIEDLLKFCDIDDVALGYWKIESKFRKAKFIRQKCYLEDIEDEKTGEYKIKITCAGMPESCYKYVTWEKFKTGFTCGGKLTYKSVKGGVKLVETEFTIKDEVLRKNIEKF